MLGIRLGSTSYALRGSTARAEVVSLATRDPVDAGFRTSAGSTARSLSWRLSQLRSLVPGFTPTDSASQPTPCEHPTAAASSSTRAAGASPVFSPSTPPASSTSSSVSPVGNPTDSNSSPCAAHPQADPPCASVSAPTSAPTRGAARLHIPVHVQTSHHSPQATAHSHRHSHTTHHHHPQHHPMKRPRHHSHQPADDLQPHHRHPHHNHNHHPTLRLIASRLRSGSKPGARTDGARLGLVVEGGGMRGCISGAMLMALYDLGCTNCFDAVYGASAGAINATYYLTGQRHGLRIYHEDLTRGSAFLDIRNLFSGSSRPVMNIDFLIDQVMHTAKPLDWDAVLASPTPLKVVASCLDSLQPVLLSDFADRAELAEALKATAAVPQIAGPPRTVRGRTLVDAAVFEPVPVQSAIRDGCSHVLVLCTRPAPTRRSPWAKRVRSTIEVLVKATVLNAPHMRDAWRTAHREPASSPASKDEQLLAALRSCPHQFARDAGAYVLPLYPDHTAGCHPLCLDPATLEAACEVGREALMRLLAPVVAAARGAGPATDLSVVTEEGYGAGEVGRELEGVMGLEGTSWAAAAASMGSGSGAGSSGGGGSDGGSWEFGGAELYSADTDLRFRP
ncbi:hypothetical protein PLESTM_001275600 [Pleodorina starrii]|nr:hypothetical protein PLESTM_001275600 [Pleodorina starrii]